MTTLREVLKSKAESADWTNREYVSFTFANFGDLDIEELRKEAVKAAEEAACFCVCFSTSPDLKDLLVLIWPMSLADI